MCHLLLWTALSALHVETASAQQRIQIFRGGKIGGASNRNVQPGQITRSASQAEPEVSPSNRPEKPPETRYSPEQIQRIRQSAASLADSSFDAFRRGLMTLHDHIDQLELAANAEYRLATTPSDQVAVAGLHLQRMHRIERALAAFDQPNAEGSLADLFLARALEAQAEYDLATAAGQTTAAEFAALRARRLAERHLVERRFDSSLGIASLPVLLHAEMLTPDGAARSRELLSNLVRQTRRWNELGAGIGRADKLLEAEFELTRLDFFTAFDSPSQNVQPSLLAAREISQRLFEQKVSYYRNGTAGLHEIARAWNNMQQIVEYASSLEEGVSPETLQRSRQNLNQIVALARSRQDRGGRIAADITYISLLNQITPMNETAPE